MKELPVIRHPFCQQGRCDVCLEDAFALEAYLLEQVGISKRHIDILGHYRTWLDRTRRIPEAETEHGWFHPDVFAPDVVADYIAWWKEE